jgi:hypothetical protein
VLNYDLTLCAVLYCAGAVLSAMRVQCAVLRAATLAFAIAVLNAVLGYAFLQCAGLRCALCAVKCPVQCRALYNAL